MEEREIETCLCVMCGRFRPLVAEIWIGGGIADCIKVCVECAAEILTAFDEVPDDESV